MSKLSLDIGELGGAISQEIELLAQPNPLDDLMAQALESPRGIALEFPNERAAIRKRFQIYTRRRQLQAAGIQSFNSIVVLLDKETLTITREPEFKVSEL